MTRTAAIVGLVLALAGCDGSNIFAANNLSSARVDVVGLYLLVSVGGESLPVILDVVDDVTIEITASRVELTRDGLYEASTQFRLTGRGVQQIETLPASGTYTVEGGSVFYESSEGNRGSLQYRGNTLTEFVDGRSFVYRR